MTLPKEIKVGEGEAKDLLHALCQQFKTLAEFADPESDIRNLISAWELMGNKLQYSIRGAYNVMFEELGLHDIDKMEAVSVAMAIDADIDERISMLNDIINLDKRIEDEL